MTAFTESIVEEAALEWFGALGYSVVAGPSIGPGEKGGRAARPSSKAAKGVERMDQSPERLKPPSLRSAASLLFPRMVDELVRTFALAASMRKQKACGSQARDTQAPAPVHRVVAETKRLGGPQPTARKGRKP